MTYVVASRSDLTLDAVHRVAWEGEALELGPDVTRRMDDAHAAFAAYVAARVAEDPGVLLYGVTSGVGDAGGTLLTADERRAGRRGLWTGASFGEPLPERVTRGIVLARLANLVDGHAGARGSLASAVVGLLDGSPLPHVPAQGNGGSGEILALGHLLGPITMRLELEPREQMALANGSPCAAALVADGALVARGRTALAEGVLPLSAEALQAPLDAYAPELGALWGDEHQAAALTSLGELLRDGAPDRLDHQAPASFRVLPRVLGRVREAQALTERTAATALLAVTDNPVFLPPSPGRPRGGLLSNGGFHDDRAHPALDGLAHAWADLAALAQRHVDALVQHPATAPQLTSVALLHMVAAGRAQEAVALARTTTYGLGGFGQNDLPSPAFAAWGTAQAVGRHLEGVLAVLAALASQVLDADARSAPPALQGLLADVRAAFPPVRTPRALGPDAERLADAFAHLVHP